MDFITIDNTGHEIRKYPEGSFMWAIQKRKKGKRIFHKGFEAELRSDGNLYWIATDLIVPLNESLLEGWEIEGKMNFLEAVEEMKKGKKVKSNDTLVYKIINNQIYLEIGLDNWVITTNGPIEFADRTYHIVEEKKR